MDTVAKRLCRVIRYAGYGLALYLNYEFFLLDPKFSSQIFSNVVHFFLALAVCAFVPLLIEWILVGTDGMNND